MTDLEQALTISGIIFGVMMVSQYGRRKYSLHKLLLPLASVGYFGYSYLGGAPVSSVDWVVYTVGAVIGIGFGVVATATTGVERDDDGSVHTVCGTGFVATWLSAMLLRVVFIYSAEHIGWFRNHLGEFMQQHSIVTDAIAPFFVIMALAMVVSRVAMVFGRVQALPAATCGRTAVHA